MSDQPLLSVEDLAVEDTVDRASFGVAPGGALALLGAGASEAALAPLRLTPSTGRIVFAGTDLMTLSERQLRDLRGNEIGAVFADAAGSLHPSYKLGWQMVEAVRAHHRISRTAARDRAVDALEAVGIAEAHRRVHAYPRELPLQIRLRALLGMALINRPQLLIVEDPLGDLDWAARASIVELVGDLRRRLGFALLLATADASVAQALGAEPLTLKSDRATLPRG